MGAAAILGGEKRDDLPKDGIWEIADAVHPRFYGFLGSGGGGVADLPVQPGAGSTTGVVAGGSLIFLTLGSADSFFREGFPSHSRI